MQTMHWTIGRTSLDRHSTPVQGLLWHDLNDTGVPTEESRIESQTVNTEEKPNERAEEERSQSDDTKLIR